MNFFGFGQSAEVEILLDPPDSRRRPAPPLQLDMDDNDDASTTTIPLYYDGETISGRIVVNLRKPGSKYEHQGIRVEFIGQIEMFYERGTHHEFVSLIKDLARPGELTQARTAYDFDFSHVEKPYESYSGSNVKLRYLLRATITRRLSDVVKEQELHVHTVAAYPLLNTTIKMEVGIEDSLHIEFEYNKSKYHLADVIVGKIYFLLVRVKIKHMELSILRKEFTGYGPGSYDVAESVLARFEIMDGAPARGESIPIRLFLAGYPDLSPTMKEVQKKFSVRYFINLVLVDEEDRRYFKQQEIVLWRRGEKLKAHPTPAKVESAANSHPKEVTRKPITTNEVDENFPAPVKISSKPPIVVDDNSSGDSTRPVSAAKPQRPTPPPKTPSESGDMTAGRLTPNSPAPTHPPKRMLKPVSNLFGDDDDDDEE